MICGWFSRGHGARSAQVVAAMAQAARVHGDERWAIQQAPAGLAIAIIHRDADDDPAAHAPAVSTDRRFWLWMAGEAYDGGTLCHVPTVAASRLPAFRRTLLDALLERGPDALASLDGRYQIVLYDASSMTVTVATDRFGGMPIFWARSSSGTAFAGGVRAVLMAPGIGCEPDPDAIREAVTFGGFRLGGRTNVRGVQRLRGGTLLTIAEATSSRDYWTWPGAREARGQTPCIDDTVSDTELIEEAHRLWQRAIAVRLSDGTRPGQTLSGGLDSRAILAEAGATARSWTAVTYGVERCDDARYARRAASAAGATWVFRPLYHGSSPDWLERRTALIQETDGLVQLSDLMHCESLPLQAALLDVHLSGYIGDLVCGGSYDSVVDAPSLMAKLPYSGVAIGWNWEPALQWCADTIAALAPSEAKFAIYEHKLPQAIHPIFQSYAPYMRLRTPFTDYALFDFFAARSRRTRQRLYATWLVGKYPALFRTIADQRTGLPVTAPAAVIALERLRRGGMRAASRALHALSLPAPRPRIRSYHDEHRRWAAPGFRERIEGTILRRDSLAAGIFGRAPLTAVLGDWFDRGAGPVQVIGALYTYEAYHRDLAAHLRQAAQLADAAAPRASVVT